MFIYYINEKRYAKDSLCMPEDVESPFTTEILGKEHISDRYLGSYDEYIYEYRFKALQDRGTGIKTKGTVPQGINGAICAFPDNYFVNYEQLPVPQRENIYFMTSYIGQVTPRKSIFHKHQVISAKDEQFCGLLISSPDSRTSLCIYPPVQDSFHKEHYSIVDCYNRNEAGNVMVSGLKNIISSIIYNDIEIVVADDSAAGRKDYHGSYKTMDPYAQYPLASYARIYTLTQNGNEIGNITKLDRYKRNSDTFTTLRVTTTLTRLFAFCDDKYTDIVSLILAYLHTEKGYRGMASTTSTYKPDIPVGY